jgi:hypothetical protein
MAETTTAKAPQPGKKPPKAAKIKAATAMVLIVTAPDAAAVHRAIAKVRLAGKIEVRVTDVTHLTG